MEKRDIATQVTFTSPVIRIIHGGDDVQAELAAAVGIYRRIPEYLRKRGANSLLKIRKILIKG